MIEIRLINGDIIMTNMAWSDFQKELNYAANMISNIRPCEVIDVNGKKNYIFLNNICNIIDNS